MTFLKINNLDIEYQTRKETINASRNVSFTLERGEIIGIVGESGSGKSTVANAIINLIDKPGKITNGSILLDETELCNNEEVVRTIRGKKIGFIFQDPQTSLNPLFTIKDQLVETIQTHTDLDYNKALEKSIKLLTEVGIENPHKRINDYPHQFSGGMRQRVVIALAISCEPDLLIADEPTTALDVSIQFKILNLLKKLTLDRNLGVLIITHDIGVIAEITDKVIIMRYGKIVEYGKTHQVLSKPASIECKSLVMSVPPANKKIDRFKLLSPEGKQIIDTSLNLTNNIIKNWKIRDLSNKKLLDFINVTKVFDGIKILSTKDADDKIQALDNVSFSIFEGESFGLVGESGSGKSTIAKIISGLLPPSKGEVKFENTSLFDPKNKLKIKKFRGQIQMIFQDPYSSLNPRFNIKDIISEPIKFFQKNIDHYSLDQNVNDLIDIVGISRTSLERFPHEFSGGQRQRISIARALATKPRLLICDEPTSALDVTIQAQVLNLLKDLQEQLNLTILFISHDLPVIRQMCDRVAILKKGCICEINQTESIFNNPKNLYTKELLRLMPKIESII
ncbi:MAG: dipeptide ABC transporter ATP-binding protein [Candidatus Puniceispirillales bacterium]